MQHYNKSAAAGYLKISRTTLYKWLGGRVQNLFTQKELDRLAAAHGRLPPKQRSLEGLAAQVSTLQDTVDRLGERVAALEQGHPSPPTPRIRRPTRSVTSYMQAPSETNDLASHSLPPPARTFVARWVAQHGGKENTIRRWPDLPQDPREALRFVQARMIDLGYRVGNARLYPCSDPRCVCHEVLAEALDKEDMPCNE